MQFIHIYSSLNSIYVKFKTYSIIYMRILRILYQKFNFNARLFIFFYKIKVMVYIVHIISIFKTFCITKNYIMYEIKGIGYG